MTQLLCCIDRGTFKVRREHLYLVIIIIVSQYKVDIIWFFESEFRRSFARCPAGRRQVTHGTSAHDVCENINECAEFLAAGVPLCRHGVCRDLDDGYVCHCDPGYVGVDCSTRLEASSWSLRSSTLVVVTLSLTLFLGKDQSLLHQFPCRKSVTSWQLSRCKRNSLQANK